MIVLGLDFETTGVNVEKDTVTEVGMVLWDSDLRIPTKMLGFLVHNPSAVWDPTAKLISGLSPELCEKYGFTYEKALKHVISWYNECDIVLAHNGNNFDKPVFYRWAKSLGYELEDKPWIDTSEDIEYRMKTKSMKLGHLASDHGFLNPFPHRALFDVMTMLKIFDSYDFESVILRFNSPKIIVRAEVSYEDRNLAKERGYSWEAGNKTWKKSIIASELEKEKKEAGFRVTVLPN
jgi:DNA polymerase-3 subunit epsilon